MLFHNNYKNMVTPISPFSIPRSAEVRHFESYFILKIGATLLIHCQKEKTCVHTKPTTSVPPMMQACSRLTSSRGTGC